MGAGQSKDELLYQEVQNGNHDAVKALRRSGASLEWIDKEGRTPLILACTRGELLDMAITLLNLGANVDVYRPGMHRGTPLHHAAKRGLEKTVTLLLSRGAKISDLLKIINLQGNILLDSLQDNNFFGLAFQVKQHLLKQDPLSMAFGIEDDFDKIGDEMTAVIFNEILLLDITLLHQHLPPLSQVVKDYALFVMVITGGMNV
ncbi:hypothetical protein L7F22_022325 [Adiantum nelumboides]|nr:hypothetical protein [Adiantum nelumboides]